MNLWKDKDWLEEQFAIPGKTIKMISVSAKCDERTIRRNAKRLGVKSKTISEQASFRQTVFSKIKPELLDVIYGELLGDGSLSSRSIYSARYVHTTPKFEYLHWLKKNFRIRKSEM